MQVVLGGGRVTGIRAFGNVTQAAKMFASALSQITGNEILAKDYKPDPRRHPNLVTPLLKNPYGTIVAVIIPYPLTKGPDGTIDGGISVNNGKNIGGRSALDLLARDIEAGGLLGLEHVVVKP